MIKVYNKKIQINNKSIIFDTTIKKIIYFSDIFVVLIRENKEIPDDLLRIIIMEMKYGKLMI